MRKKIQMFVCTLVAALMVSPVMAFADAAQTVTLSEDSKLIYESDGADLLSAFDGMAPGDSRTVQITVKNDNTASAAFYISGDTIKALEESNANARGGAYSYNLSVGSTLDTARSLLDTVAGGYDAAQTASDAGLADVTELNDYQFLERLGKGQSTNVYLTLSLDGESFDASYANAAGELAFNFRAYYQENDTTPVVVTQYNYEKGQASIIRSVRSMVTSGTETIADALVPLAAAAKTGDEAPIFAIVIIFAAGVALIAVSAKKKGTVSRNEK
jgi:hypothetical protein